MSNAPAEMPSDDQSVRVTLSRPIQAHGEDISELVFREPTAADLVAIGASPVTMDGAGDVPRPVFDAQKMTQMMARLASVPPSSILKIGSVDWHMAAYALLPFFLPFRRTTSPSAATNSPGSTDSDQTSS